MDERLINHLAFRLHQFRKQSDVAGLVLLDGRNHPLLKVGEPESGTPHELPITFAEQNLGTLKVFCAGTLPTNALDFCASLAAVWSGPVPLAIRLDLEMELLKEAHPNYDWCGIYRVDADRLLLTAFRGPTSPHEVIAVNKGICGAAILHNSTLNIPDVTLDSRYLACDTRTRSEIVVPIRNRQGEAIAEIDIDSHSPQAFSAADATRLEQLADRLASLWQ